MAPENSVTRVSAHVYVIQGWPNVGIIVGIVTLALGGKMARFDPRTKEFLLIESGEGGKRGGYPHTLRFDQNGICWYTDAAMNAIFYLLRTGCPWRYLPRDEFPPRSTVYNIFRKFQKDGVWEAIWEELHMTLRERLERNSQSDPCLRVRILDAQRGLIGSGIGQNFVAQVAISD